MVNKVVYCNTLMTTLEAKIERINSEMGIIVSVVKLSSSDFAIFYVVN